MEKMMVMIDDDGGDDDAAAAADEDKNTFCHTCHMDQNSASQRHISSHVLRPALVNPGVRHCCFCYNKLMSTNINT